MEISKTYNPSSVENKWYLHWLNKKYFHSVPDYRTPYTIVIPPPNVTGVLHMGHVLNNTLQDVFIRRARMLGKNACWVPGTDHASIATEAKVVAMLREQGIKKSDLSREEFLEYAWEWKEKYGGIILQQLKKLGCSCDWERTSFTMDAGYSDDVINVFIDLYKKGFIYRGWKMINWDPEAQTALSNEEVEYKEVNAKLYYVKYKIKNENDFITIATTRPETILGDTALCVHPHDERYKKYVGKTAFVPVINREIPIIADAYVDTEFGSGALKITPAHDVNDYELGIKHKLQVINILNENGTLNNNAGILIGEDRFIARKKLIKRIEEKGQLVKIEELKHSVGFSERTNALVEPRLSLQWFLKMKEISKPALDAVLNNEIKLHPDKYINTYKYWMENVRDWCISRQLWWGQRIPAWYDEEGNYVVAKTHNEALQEYKIKNPEKEIKNLKQDEDVLDTWASSWIWPVAVFNGFKNPEGEINYYYPTDVLVTAPEILFFWVARMIIAGYEYRNEKPFSDVYLTGIVRDKLRRKMSKSLGNSPDPLDMIEKFGADAVRMGTLLCSPAGNDIIFDEKLIDQGRNFSNKLWNAARLIKGWEIENKNTQSDDAIIKWFEIKLADVIEDTNTKFNEYKISEALMNVYSFVYDDFCSWYLECIKPDFGEPVNEDIYNKTREYFTCILKLLHPFMPFITEEIYHLLNTNSDEDIIISAWPQIKNIRTDANNAYFKNGEKIKQLVSQIRDIRAKNKVSPKEKLRVFTTAKIPETLKKFIPYLLKMANLSEFTFTDSEMGNTITFISENEKFYLLINKTIDRDIERKNLSEQLEYQKGFLQSVEKKLSNAQFIKSAPAQVVETEKKKKEDALLKISILQQSLAKLD